MDVNSDRKFLRQFSAVIAGFMVLTIALIFLARYVEPEPEGDANPSQAILAEKRVAPVGAVRVALEFAAARDDTLVIVTADHETGGMALGRDGIYRWDAGPLRGLEQTPKRMGERYATGEQPLSEIVAGELIFALTEQEAQALDAARRARDRFPEVSFDLLTAVPGMAALLPSLIYGVR